MTNPLILYSKDAHQVMYIRGNVARKETLSKYMLESPPGWGFEKQLYDAHGKALPADTLTMLKRFGVGTIQVKDKTSGKLYIASRQTFEENFVEADRKNGVNQVLALPFWKVFTGISPIL